MAKSAPKRAKKKPTRRKAKAPATPKDLGIQDAWRYVDRFCRALWVKHLRADPPSSLAEIITALRDEELIPAHHANMMHTIRSLRNLLVHENVAFDEHETMIALAAWHIIREWAQKHEAEAWRLTMSVCERRAA